MKTFDCIKHTIRYFIITVLTVFFGVLLFLNLPFIQKELSAVASRELRNLFQTEVSIGNIDMGLLNRIILQDVLLKDREHNEMLRVERLSATFDFVPLLKGKIRIGSVQLLGMKAQLCQKDTLSAPNFQFVLDALASKDTVKKESVLDLRINTVLIRRGTVSYDLLSAPVTPGVFNPRHIGLNDLAGTLSLKALTKDSINAQIRRFSFSEQSGLHLKKLTARLKGNRHFLLANNVQVGLPNSLLRMDTLEAHFDSIPHFPTLDESTTYRTRIQAVVVPADLQALVPQLAHFQEAVEVKLSAEGQGNHARLTELSLCNPDRSLLLQLAGSAQAWDQPRQLYLTTEIQRAEVTPQGIGWLTQNLTGKSQIPAILTSNRYVRLEGRLEGYLHRLGLTGSLASGAGQLQAHVTMHADTLNGQRSYSGKLTARQLHLGILTNQTPTLGPASFEVELKGFSYRNGMAQTYIKGNIAALTYQGYEYHHVGLDGHYTPGGFNGRIALHDPNGEITLSGAFATQTPLPTFQLTAHLRDFNPHALHLTSKHPDTRFSASLKANFSGRSIDDVQGALQMDSFEVKAPTADKCYFLPRLAVSATPSTDNGKRIDIRSDMLNAELEGAYTYRSLPASVLRLLQRYIPSLIGPQQPADAKPAGNRFRLQMQVNNTDLLSKVLDIPLELHYPVRVNGEFDESRQLLRLNGHLPEFVYNQSHYESASINCFTTDTDWQCHVRANKRMGKGSTLNLALHTRAENDVLSTTLNWGNDTHNSYYGKVSADTRFVQTGQQLETHIDLLPGKVVLNDTVWNLHPSGIDIAPGRIVVRDFLFEHEDKSLQANGVIGKADTDSCLLTLHNIDVQYIIDMVQFKAVKFGGLATGTVHLNHLLDSPDISTRLQVARFALNDGLLGNADIQGLWDPEIGGIRLNADIRDGARSTLVKGYVSPKMDGLDLDIRAHDTNLAFLNPFLENIFSNVRGYATGRVRLFGPFSDLDLEGDLSASASVKVKVLNTDFHAYGDSVRLRPGLISFKDIRLKDNGQHEGTANGTVTHHKLRDMAYNFRFDTRNLQLFHYEQASPDFPFYGNMYATGSVVLNGGNNQLRLDGQLRSDANSTFTYVTTTAAEATNTQFITFVDKTPRRQSERVDEELYHHTNLALRKQQTDDDEGPEGDIRVNLLVEATPAVDMKIIMDPLSGDYIAANGYGNLQVDYYNKGEFQVFGNYNIEKGIYKMSMQNIIRKDFSLRSGGVVNFNGNPLHANVNVQAAYTVNSASLNDLVADASSTQGTVKVNCLVNMTGNLTAPVLKFDLELPTVSDEDRELVRSLTSTEDQMNTQIIYLLSVGKFYAYDSSNASSQSNATSSLAFSTLSGQLNNMLSQVIDSRNWNFGTNLSTGTKGWSNVEAEAILSGSLLNNRLIINGNFGYRNNPLRSSNFVGDFEAVWLLTKNGEWRLRGYNQTNDRYFTKSTLTTQGIGVMYKKDFNNWKELTNWLLSNRKRKKNTTP